MASAIAYLAIIGGMAMIVLAGYLQYASLPAEHTRAAVSKRAALALGGLALVLLGNALL